MSAARFWRSTRFQESPAPHASSPESRRCKYPAAGAARASMEVNMVSTRTYSVPSFLWRLALCWFAAFTIIALGVAVGEMVG